MKLIQGVASEDNPPTRYEAPLRLPTRGDVRAAARRCSVAEIMTRHVPLARPDFALDSLAAVLLDTECGAVVVVEATGRPIGIVTRSDVLRTWDAQRFGEIRSRPSDRRPRFETYGMHVTLPADARAVDVMSPLVRTLPDNATVAEGSATLARLGVQRVVVTGPDSVFAGILTAFDVATWVAGETAATAQ